MGENKLFVGSLPPDITKEEIEFVFKTYGAVTDVHVIAGDRNRSQTGQACAFVMYESREAAETAIQALNSVYKIREDAPNAIQVNWARSGNKGKDGGKGGGGGGWSNNGYGKGDGGNYGGCGGYDGGCGGGFGGCGMQQGGLGESWDSWGKGGGGGGGGCWGGKGGGGGGGWDDGKGGKGGTRLFVGNLPPDVTDDQLQYVFKAYGNVLKTFIMSGKSKSGQNCAFVEYELSDEAETAIQTLHEKYEIKPGSGPIFVKRARNNRPGPY
ncbi:BRN1 [Symbiodinium natans]|uniref:BRN1 protein n=1 Tax=Symbiodinium natans TaxID=878477 RepID=A0A812MG42_9DINO|nr:BRN1 [Symbiodinium natans]